ncbi:MAG: hypothetical protein U1E53_16205 [Dongiaceae bacterium]
MEDFQKIQDQLKVGHDVDLSPFNVLISFNYEWHHSDPPVYDLELLLGHVQDKRLLGPTLHLKLEGVQIKRCRLRTTEPQVMLGLHLTRSDIAPLGSLGRWLLGDYRNENLSVWCQSVSAAPAH